jgi:hypothetical protein
VRTCQHLGAVVGCICGVAQLVVWNLCCVVLVGLSAANEGVGSRREAAEWLVLFHKTWIPGSSHCLGISAAIDESGLIFHS